MKLLILSRYGYSGSSSRYRIIQYLPFLEKEGWQITIHSLLDDNYVQKFYLKEPLPKADIIRSYLKRINILLHSEKYDLIWLQQEAFPWLPPFIETFLLKSKIPLVVDHDDAFFHRYDLHKWSIVRKILGKKIDRTMKLSNLVIVGNAYLAERASLSSQNVKILPTVIDILKYNPDQKFKEPHDKFIIGWIGSPPNACYVKNIEGPLGQFCNQFNGKLNIVGAGEAFETPFPFENIEWNEETEVDEIKKFDVGIMPLTDSPWERGKCGFKLIQYMACGIPVIASPVGVNNEIVKEGVNGFLANTDADWFKYLKILENNPDLRKQMGLNGRKLVEEKFTLQVNSPILTKLLKETAFPG